MRRRIETAALAIARVVQRKDHLGGELAALFEHLVDGPGIDFLIAGQLFQFTLGIEQFMQHELHVAQRSDVLGHYFFLL